MPPLLIALLLTLAMPTWATELPPAPEHPAAATAATPTKRTSAARRAFIRANPCPATGEMGHSRSSCPGWRVDHIVPLACGGPDRPDNMQWLTAADHKAKSAWERKPCRK